MSILNRQAGFNYELLETIEAGLVLTGSEVKSIRAGQANLNDAYARVRDGEVWLNNLHIAPYSQGHQENYDPTRTRKLLFHKKEVVQLTSKLHEKGLSLIPTKIYSTHNQIKVELALARGKKKYDKRESIKKRELERELRRKTK